MRALCSLSFLDQLLYLETTQPIDARLVGFHLSVAPVREFFQFLISGNFLKLLNLFVHLSLYLKKKTPTLLQARYFFWLIYSNF